MGLFGKLKNSLISIKPIHPDNSHSAVILHAVRKCSVYRTVEKQMVGPSTTHSLLYQITYVIYNCVDF